MTGLTRRRLLGASAMNGGGFIVASGVVLAWSLLMVHAYSGEASGQLLLAISLAGMINSLDLGVSMGLVRLISMERDAKFPYSPETYFRSAMWVTMISEIVIGSVVVAIWRSRATVPIQWDGFVSLIAFALSAQALLLCSGAMKGLLDFRAANLISTGSTLFVYSTGTAMALMRHDPWRMLDAMGAVQFITAVAAVIYSRSRLACHDTSRLAVLPGFALKAYPGLLRVSIRLFPQMFTGIFFLHVQRFLIARYVGLDAVAVTSFAYSVATRLHAVVNAFLEVIFPMARQLQSQGVDPRRFCVRLGAVSAAGYLAATAAAIVLVNLMVKDAVPILAIFALGVTFAIASAPAFHLLNGSGAALKVSMCSVLSPAIFLGITPILHNSMGVGGDLLLPTAYSVSMMIMFMLVVVMVGRYASAVVQAAPGQ